MLTQEFAKAVIDTMSEQNDISIPKLRKRVKSMVKDEESMRKLLDLIRVNILEPTAQAMVELFSDDKGKQEASLITIQVLDLMLGVLFGEKGT